MLTHPTAAEIIAGVGQWLPLDGSASPFALRVAKNALEIAHRDVTLGPIADARAAERIRALGLEGTDRDTLDRLLVEAIRAGDIAPDDARLLAHMKASALDSLAIDQPKYAHQLTP